MALVRDRELVYDLPRVEELWSGNDWKKATEARGLPFVSRLIATEGLKLPFEARRENPNLIDRYTYRVADKDALFLTRIWTMPDRVLQTLASATTKLIR